jgi:hypothetical protein
MQISDFSSFIILSKTLLIGKKTFLRRKKIKSQKLFWLPKLSSSSKCFCCKDKRIIEGGFQALANQLPFFSSEEKKVFFFRFFLSHLFV